MLALTRKNGESIMVGDNVEVVVLGVNGEQVRLGIIAPKSIAVHRKEIYQQILTENKVAAKSGGHVALRGLRQTKPQKDSD